MLRGSPAYPRVVGGASQPFGQRPTTLPALRAKAQPRAMRAVVRPRGHHQRAEARRAPKRSRLAQFLVENWAFGIMTAVMVQAASYLSVKDHEDSASSYPCPTCVT